MKKVGTLIREGVGQQIREGVQTQGSTFVVSYSHLASSQMSDLRKALSHVGANVYVSKNRIAKKTLNDLNLKELSDLIQDQTAFVWSSNDSVEVAKVLVKFIKDFKGLKVQGGLLDGRVIIDEEVQRLADLPSREILLSMLLQTIQSPLVRLAGALNGKTRELINLLKQLSEKSGGK